MCYNILRISEHPKTNRRKVECNMKLITRLLALLTVLTLLAVSGLAETVTTQDQVVATVNGTPLYLTELQQAYNYYSEYYAQQGYTVTYAQMVDVLVDTEALRQLVAENGFANFTDEERAAQEAEAKASWDNAIQSYVSAYLSEDTEEARAAAAEQGEQYFRALGYSPEYLVENLAEQQAQTKYMNSLVDPASVTREEVLAYLNSIAAREQAEVGNSASMYELYQVYMGREFKFTPDGYRRVIHILLKPDEDVMTAYTTACEALEALKEKAEPEAEEEATEPEEEAVEEPEAEAAETAETPEAAEAAEPAEAEAAEPVAAEPAAEEAPEAEPAEEAAEAPEAEAEPAAEEAAETEAEPEEDPYEKLQKALDDMVIASLKKTIDEIETRLANGEEFAAIAPEYNQDTGEDFTEGYLVHPESIMWDPAFRDAAFSEEMAKPGDHSKPVMGSYGVHILYYMADVPGGTAELTDELYAELAETLLEDKRYDIAEKAITEKEATAEIVKETAVIAELEGAASEVSIDFADGADDTEETVEAPADGEQN